MPPLWPGHNSRATRGVDSALQIGVSPSLSRRRRKGTKRRPYEVPGHAGIPRTSDKSNCWVNCSCAYVIVVMSLEMVCSVPPSVVREGDHDNELPHPIGGEIVRGSLITIWAAIWLPFGDGQQMGMVAIKGSARIASLVVYARHSHATRSTVSAFPL